MPKIIDHEKRKRAILRKSLSLFAREGYKNTSLSHLAEACDISRPTLYLYFSDKDEIFQYALKSFTDDMYRKYKNITGNSGKSYCHLIFRIYADIVDKCGANSDFLVSLVDFVMQENKSGKGFSDLIRRRTVRLEYLLSRLLSQAVKQGELKKINVRDTVDHMFRLVQALIFQIVYNDGNSRRDREIAIFKDWLNCMKV
ncbi:MAG: TetR/AcrR family transcriptional regulator [Spirochaetaceae bacterium]|jgi:TetR/AcrR family transcriptional regulator|nr:TetR/AcrR family transcriptional regulator [Spirochaetaceae bacterium]